MYKRSYNIQYKFTMALQYEEEVLWNDISDEGKSQSGSFRYRGMIRKRPSRKGEGPVWAFQERGRSRVGLPGKGKVPRGPSRKGEGPMGAFLDNGMTDVGIPG